MTNLAHKNRWSRIVVSAVALAALLLLPIANVPAALSAPLFSPVTVPNLVGFEGYLTDGTGQPISNGAHNLVFRVYDAATSGTILWTETQTPTVTSGLYSVVLGISTTFSSTVWSVGPRWIGVTVDGGSEITPRTEVASVPFALNAEHANSAESATSSANASSVPWSGITGMPSGAGTGITISVGNSISVLSAYQLPQGCLAGQVVQSTGGGWNCLANVTTGSATSGRVAIWGPSNTLTGTSGLLSANNTLTVTNGLNVGTASGATGGQIRASGTVTGSNLSGTNTGDATLAGENYLSLSGQTITANPVNLSGTNATGTLAAARFPVLTGDVTTTSGSLSTSIATGAVTSTKIASGAVTSAKIAADTITASNIANRTRSLFVPVGWSASFSFSYPEPADFNNPNYGIREDAGSGVFTLGGAVVVPNDYASGWSVQPIFLSIPSVSAGNAKFTEQYNWANTGSAITGGSQTNAGTILAIAATGSKITAGTARTPTVSAGNIFTMNLSRDTSNPSDTASGAYFIGWLITYTADM